MRNEWKILCIGSSIHYVSHIFWRATCKTVSHHSFCALSPGLTLLVTWLHYKLCWFIFPAPDTRNLPPNFRESGSGAGPGVATSLLLKPYSRMRVSVGVRPPSRSGAEASLAMMARWEAEWWWWVRCSAATNFDLYAAPSSETEVSPASNSFHSL